MINDTMTCEAFDATFSEYLEGTLEGKSRAQVDSHLRECLRCAALLRDVESIREEASSLPDLVPSRDLWEGIEARIAAPVIPLTARPERQRRLTPAWMGIAAAALVVSTAGVTYLLTARSIRAPQSVAAIPVIVSGARNANGGVPESSGGATTPEVVNGSDEPNAAQTGTGRQRVAQPVPASNSIARMASATPGVVVPRSEGIYGKEIEMLQKIVGDRKTQLDPSTVATIEKNLLIIDAAIEQSRAALAKDPASRLLSEQLNHVLDQKVELLRRAAMLPAST
jgi:anti-sigma factor RsiW